MSDRQGMGWSGRIYGSYPVQGEGRVDGHAWYFRARSGAWSLEIVEDTSLSPDSLPVVGFASGWKIVEDWWDTGRCDADDMPADIAWQLIEQTLARFRRGDLPYVKGESP